MKHPRNTLYGFLVATAVLSAGAAYSGSMSQGAAAEYAAMQPKMSADMKRATGATADSMFASKMSVHHQGAIDMAMIELKYGRDANMRAHGTEDHR